MANNIKSRDKSGKIRLDRIRYFFRFLAKIIHTVPVFIVRRHKAYYNKSLVGFHIQKMNLSASGIKPVNNFQVYLETHVLVLKIGETY